MAIDRKKLLEGRRRARRVLALYPDLPQRIKELYKNAAFHAELALKLDELGKKPPRADGA